MSNRRFRIFVILSVAVAIALSGYALHQLEANRTNELNNRVRNVHTWCNAINEGLREGLRLHHNEKAYQIRPLHCHELEEKTRQSSFKESHS